MMHRSFKAGSQFWSTLRNSVASLWFFAFVVLQTCFDQMHLVSGGESFGARRTLRTTTDTKLLPSFGRKTKAKKLSKLNSFTDHIYRYIRSGSTGIFNLLFLTAIFALNACCWLPFADCVVNVKEYNVTPKVLEFENSLVRSCIVKASLLSSRDKKYADTVTVDVTIRFAYDSSLKLDTIDPPDIFIAGNHYLKAGTEQITFNPKITKRTIARKFDAGFEEIEYHLFVRVAASLLNNNLETLIIRELNFANKLKDDLEIEVMLNEK